MLGRSPKRLPLAYQSCFGRAGMRTEDSEIVLRDLREFCRGNQTSLICARDGRIDPNATLVAEGRREVFLRVCTMLNVDPVVLFDGDSDV